MNDPLPVIDTLIYYDGPILYVSERAGEQVLVMLLDVDTKALVYLVSPISDENLELLKTNKLAIADATRSGGKAWVTVVDSSKWQILCEEEFAADQLKAEWLSEENVFLEPEED